MQYLACLLVAFIMIQSIEKSNSFLSNPLFRTPSTVKYQNFARGVVLREKPKAAADHHQNLPTFALNKHFLSDLIDLILKALPSILAPLKEVDYDKVREVKPTEKGQTLKDYKKSHKGDWDHEHAAKTFATQYLHDVKTEEEKQKKSPEILLQIIKDLEKLGLLDKLNNEIKNRIKDENFKNSKLSPDDQKSAQDWIDLNNLREELLKQGNKK
mmetsp:Transcript_5978/g.6578  ORF Transcript_5978/g.6578 Transcript_5978/m.6578 type:complete len:213 (+) Transcript_5978:110-748(+)|eukprot:gene5788-6228_t